VSRVQRRDYGVRGSRAIVRPQGVSLTGEFASLSRCVQSGDTLVLDARIETYAFCPDDPAQFFCCKEPMMNWTPPEESD
jgi:hypothetical protein